MHSSSEVTTSKRTLGDLKFTKNKKQRLSPPEVAPSSSSSSLDSLGGPAAYPAQPAQARDATALSTTSRFFPTSVSASTAPTSLSPKSQGTVLVPESSPLSSTAGYRPYQPYGYHNPPVFNHTNSWGGSRVQSGSSKESGLGDPLSSSSGFGGPLQTPNPRLQQNGASSSSSPTPASGSSRVHHKQLAIVTKTPAKAEGSRSPDQLDLLSTPLSPQVGLRGGKRRATGRIDSSDEEEEDDTLPDVSSMNPSQPKPRIVRGRPQPDNSPPLSNSTSITTSNSTLSTSQPQHDVTNDAGFLLWKFQFPDVDMNYAADVWRRSKGNHKMAQQLLSMPRPSTQNPTIDLTGRDAAVEAQQRAKRQADKERSKNSAIYATRIALANTITPTAARTQSPLNTASSSKPLPKSPQTVNIVNSSKSRKSPPPIASGSTSKVQRVQSHAVSKIAPDSPASPVVNIVKRKRVRRIAQSSDEEEEEEADSSDVEVSEEKQPSKRMSGETIRALQFFNKGDAAAFQEQTGCTSEQAAAIIGLRPFASVDDLNDKLAQGKKKGTPAGVSNRIFADCESMFKGYDTVDSVLEDCEEIGNDLRKAMASWGVSTLADPKGEGSSKAYSEVEDGALSLRSVNSNSSRRSKHFIVKQPDLLAEGVQLKEYQLLGVNWLNLLYREGYSCILADEMGLGKTVQVISFFAHIKSRYNSRGPHLIVVPSSTLENWCREFAKFAPDIQVQTYYAGKGERSQLRETLMNTQMSQHGEGWEVLITTYNLAQGDEYDRKFFKRVKWDTCVFDEGHVLKNFQSQRYQALLKYSAKWRLLLTGTPLQNNLQELVSLMNFILPKQFGEVMEDLRAIFKAKGDSKVTLLAQERISRAKKMMTPFVLRRRKDQVLKDLPKKTVRIEWCEMTELQKSIYRDALQRSRKTISDVASEPSSARASAEPPASKKPAKKSVVKSKSKEKKYLENSTNVLMDLRKAASHPMLFRTRFTDDTLTRMTKQLLKEPDFKKRDAQFQYVKEDMEVMTDSELQHFCGLYKSIQKFKQEEDCYVDAGKVQTLLKLLDEYIKDGRKVLIFSQFTQILDILQVVLQQKEFKFLVLTGATAVDVRQSLVDEFTEDESIPVFLLSTKAGGLGITLTAASVVIMFDQDYNPHNDRQAQDRAYRIGQKRDVEVVKLICRGTIEEDMLRLGETKLALDEAVAGDDGESKGAEEQEKEKAMKMGLLTSLRNQFEKEEREGKEETKKDG